MNHIRTQIQIVTAQDATNFVSLLNSDGTTNNYSLENFDATYRVNARSLLGVLYFITEHGNELYLVNDTTGMSDFPNGIDAYKVVS